MRVVYWTGITGGDGFFLNERDWTMLERAGWTINFRADLHHEYEREALSPEVDDVEQAILAWEAALGKYWYGASCDCCPPGETFMELT